jgi:hypothetical protein
LDGAGTTLQPASEFAASFGCWRLVVPAVVVAAAPPLFDAVPAGN